MSNQEAKYLAQELFEDVFGDVRKFFSIITTTAYWFVLPLSINASEHRASSSRFMNDLQLVKTLFFSLIIFLVIDEASQGGDAAIEKWVLQFMYLLVFIFFLLAFFAIGKLWRLLTSASIDDDREFSAHLLYEACTLIFMQVLIFGFFDVTFFDSKNEEFNLLGTLGILVVPIVHSVYFFSRLHARYEAKRRILGFVFITFSVLLLLFITALLNELLFREGLFA